MSLQLEKLLQYSHQVESSRNGAPLLNSSKTLLFRWLIARTVLRNNEGHRISRIQNVIAANSSIAIRAAAISSNQLPKTKMKTMRVGQMDILSKPGNGCTVKLALKPTGSFDLECPLAGHLSDVQYPQLLLACSAPMAISLSKMDSSGPKCQIIVHLQDAPLLRNSDAQQALHATSACPPVDRIPTAWRLAAARHSRVIVVH